MALRKAAGLVLHRDAESPPARKALPSAVSGAARHAPPPYPRTGGPPPRAPTGESEHRSGSGGGRSLARPSSRATPSELSSPVSPLRSPHEPPGKSKRSPQCLRPRGRVRGIRKPALERGRTSAGTCSSARLGRSASAWSTAAAAASSGLSGHAETPPFRSRARQATGSQLALGWPVGTRRTFAALPSQLRSSSPM